MTGKKAPEEGGHETRIMKRKDTKRLWRGVFVDLDTVVQFRVDHGNVKAG